MPPSFKPNVGYFGEANASASSVQFRYGERFMTTAGWLQSAGTAERTDVAFLKLESPFTGNLDVFSYVDTSMTGTAQTLGVVGYPEDQISNGEGGALMFERFEPVTWNLETVSSHLLQYPISTYLGKTSLPFM
jgi:hypothetical protein